MRITVLFLCLFPLFLFSQYAENIRTGRPGQAIGAYTLGKSVVQIQSGYNFNKVETSSLDHHLNGVNTVFRFGVLERFEISGLLNYLNETREFPTNTNPIEVKNNGIDNLQFGARINLTKNEGWIPGIGIQSRVLFKLLSDPFPRTETGLKSILSTGNKLSDRLSFSTNWVLIIPGGKAKEVGRYIANLSYSINNKIGVFGEIYGGIGANENTSFDGGFSYLVNNDLQLDISAGNQSTDIADDYFLDIGFSWRTDWRK